MDHNGLPELGLAAETTGNVCLSCSGDLSDAYLDGYTMDTDLPTADWFDLENYRNLENLSDREWHIELSERQWYYGTPFTELGWDDARRNKNFWHTPIVTYGKTLEHLRDRAEDYKDVSDWFKGELVFTGLTTDTQVHKKYYPESLYRSAEMWRNGSIYQVPNNTMILPTSRPAFHIDFNQPESVLVSDLKRIAAKWRGVSALLKDNKGHARLINTELKKAWSGCQLLPFLDLSYWAALHDIKTQRKFYADLLELTDEKKVDGCKKHAKQVNTYCATLKMQCGALG